MLIINYITKNGFYSMINMCVALSIAAFVMPAAAADEGAMVKEVQKELRTQAEQKATIANAKKLIEKLDASPSKFKEMATELKNLMGRAQSLQAVGQDLRDKLINTKDQAERRALLAELTEHNKEVKDVIKKLAEVTRAFPG